MAKQARKAAKGAKAAAAKKVGKAGKVTAGKPARAGRTHVDFGLHGMAHIVQKVREAGLESEFNNALGKQDKFVKVPKTSLTAIKNFVGSKPELAGLAKDMGSCDCPPDDPYCIYI